MTLAAAQGGLIKLNFLPLLNTTFMDPHDDIAEYISFKLRYLGKSIDELEHIDVDSEKHMDIIQKGLELPVQIARKYLWLAGASTGDDSKAAVIVSYEQHAPDDLSCMLSQLVGLDMAYTQLLKRQLMQPDREAYRRALLEIARQLPLSRDFARHNALLMGEEAVQPSQNIAHRLTDCQIAIDLLKKLCYYCTYRL